MPFPAHWDLSWLYGWELLAGAASSSWSIAGVSSLSPPMASASPGQAAVDLPAFFSLQLIFRSFFCTSHYEKYGEHKLLCWLLG